MQDALNRTTAPPAAAAPREDLYNGIHKGLRLMFADTVTRLGSVDTGNDSALAALLLQCGELLDLLELHYADEDRFVHPALERVQPGCTGRVAEQHAQHRDAIEPLRELIEVVRVSSGTTRDGAVTRLYRALAMTMAHDLEHMQFEDIELNAILWRHLSDVELQAIHGALVASIPPRMMMLALRWMLPALNPAERAGLLAGARHGMPPQAFAAVLGVARERLTQGEWRKLALALRVPA